MNIIEWHQWAQDTQRIYLAGISNENPNDPCNLDILQVDAALERCYSAFGPRQGHRYFETLMLSLPDRHPELFPELADFR
jgi:hypothetical protein